MSCAMSVFISHESLFHVVLIHHSHTEGHGRRTAAQTRAPVVLLTASKQNFYGTEDKNMPR